MAPGGAATPTAQDLYTTVNFIYEVRVLPVGGLHPDAVDVSGTIVLENL